jgi:hypothetical protein
MPRRKEYRRYLVIYPEGHFEEYLVAPPLVEKMEKEPESLSFLTPGYREIHWAGDVTMRPAGDIALDDVYRGLDWRKP